MAARKDGRAEELAAQILAVARRDGLKPGDRLIEQRLAASLGLSRGPVRSGLAALARSGLATAAPPRGYVLADGAGSVVAASALAAAAAGERHYRTIADDRLDGRLPATITEAELMRRYGLKRPDLLRLLDRIAAEGWVERLPGYGWRFAEILTSAASYAQSARFRAVIEPAAILEPGFRLAPEVIARLRAQQQRVLAGGLATLTIGEIFQFGCELHEEIARGASNPFFVEALRRVNAIRRLFTYRLLADHNHIARHIRDHLRLLDLIAAGRNADAAALMRRHLRQVPPTTG